MLDEYAVDLTGTTQVAPEHIVTGVFPHPLHGRLIERVILWVRPYINYAQARYKLSWWGNGVAYYYCIPSQMGGGEERGIMGPRPAMYEE